jgi:hypothetical protein
VKESLVILAWLCEEERLWIRKKKFLVDQSPNDEATSKVEDRNDDTAQSYNSVPDALHNGVNLCSYNGMLFTPFD